MQILRDIKYSMFEEETMNKGMKLISIYVQHIKSSLLEERNAEMEKNVYTSPVKI